MVGSKRVLVLYYSFTKQTELVLQEIADELKAAGHTVDMRRIQPIKDYTLPLDKKLFWGNWAKLWMGFNLNIPLQHMDLKGEDYDYIVFGFQPWNLAPSIPVNSFLDSDMAEIFRGKKVIGVVTCRTRWERSYRVAKEKIEKRGGQMMDGLVIMNTEEEPRNMISTGYYLFNGHNPPPEHWFSKWFRPYGIGREGVSVAREYGHDLARRLKEERIVQTRGWRVVNQPLSTIG